MNLISKKTIAAQLRRFAALMVSAAVLLCQSGITAFAETSEGQLHFYAEPCTVNAGEEIAVSFSVENNTGFAGFGVQMEYDESCFTPISVASEIGSGYMIDNTDTAEPGEFTIYWYDSENYTGNGAVFTVTLAVSENSYGLYEMLCIASEENTIQIAEDGTETAAACTWDHAEITVLNPELEAAPKLKLSSADVLAGDTAEIPLSFEQAEGISNAQISLEYDDAALTLKTITDADGEEVVYSDSAGCAVISVDTTEHALNDEWICTFSVHPYASGVSEIAASVSDAADSDGNPAAVLGASSFVTIQNDVYTMPVLVGENQQLTQPGAVTIPYTLLNPSCLMGMKLVIAFDPEFVEAESVSVQQDELLMDANMQSNVDYEKGEIVIAFYSGSPITENGTLFSLEMSVLESTVLTADYVPQDTYDGAYQYITMICCPTDIVIGSGTTETTTATTTTSQTTTVSTTTGHVATTADTSLSTSESTISTQSVTSATASSAVTTLRTSQTTTKPATTTETNTSSMTTTEPATTTATYTSSQTTTEPTTTTVTSTSSM
ncbi:MAG: hypothetical protein IJ512_07950, partial [Ruminococcus sp.]|nr:hypothetical protein [Ruminococcus sp.]